ncbi:MAG: Sec-independent protein translocase protein TatB [Pyrinomonadaceae bacterium]
MYLFIFESIGTSELLLVGIVALIFLGPRKLPEMAKKMGKMMAEFRGTANEFKETWQREVNFEEEAKALSISELEAEPVVARKDAVDSSLPEINAEAPTIKQIDPARFEQFQTPENGKPEKLRAPEPLNDKKNWL